MDKLDTMRVFVEVAKSGSFVGASNKLGMSAPAVTRHVAQLENRLRVKLFVRSTRHVRLTDAGASYLSQLQLIFEQIEEAENSVTSSQNEPRGELIVTAPVVFGVKFITPICTRFLERYPEVSVRSIYRDRIANIMLEDLDVALRIGELKDSALYAVEVGRVQSILCAAPEYLSKHGVPTSPDDLDKHTILHASSSERAAHWKFYDREEVHEVRLKPRLFCSHNASAIEAAVQGFGIARLLSYQIHEHLASGKLQPILEDLAPPPIPVSLVYASGRNASAKTRRFVDMATEELRSNTVLNQ